MLMLELYWQYGGALADGGSEVNGCDGGSFV